MKESEKFINLGYLNFEGMFDKDLCKKLNKNILKVRKINKNIFVRKKDYSIKKTKNKNNILDKFNLDFIFKNKHFLSKIKLILGEEFEVYAKRIICGVPNSIFPKWISSKMELNSINIGKFIKSRYGDLRYFHGIDYHQDIIDFSQEEGNFVTVYIYLDKVTKKMSPLNLLPGTHLGGPSVFPHNLTFKRKKIIYKTEDGKLFYSNNKNLIGDAGDVWIWHNCLLHGTQINLANEARYSLRIILRQKKKDNSSLMTKTNKKIKNIVSFKKMIDFSRYQTLNLNKRNISKLKNLKK